jgi:hypothetical protein
MKRIVLAALLTLAPLGGCGAFLQSQTVQSAALSSTSTSVSQASTLKAAGDLYVLAANAATAYLNSGQASKAAEQKITPVEAMLYKALIDGQAAEKAGNSPAAGAALSLFNSNYTKLAALVPGLH